MTGDCRLKGMLIGNFPKEAVDWKLFPKEAVDWRLKGAVDWRLLSSQEAAFRRAWVHGPTVIYARPCLG